MFLQYTLCKRNDLLYMLWSSFLLFLVYKIGVIYDVNPSMESVMNEGLHTFFFVLWMRILPLFLQGIKDLRLLCLKVISIVLSKYDSIDYGTNLWNMYFTAIQPYVEKINRESESYEIPKSLFTWFLEMRNHLKLASFLKIE